MQTDTTEKSAVKRLPILPLRDVVVYPHTVIPLFVGRERSVTALDRADGGGQRDLARRAERSRISTTRARRTSTRSATLATILQLLKLPDGTVKVLVEGIRRARLRNLEVGECFTAEAEELPEGSDDDPRRDGRAHALSDVAVRSVREAQQEDPARDPHVAVGHRSPGRLADTVAGQMALKLSEKQKVLEIAEVRPRLEHVLGLIDAEIDMLQHREADPRPREAADGEESARVLPE